MIDFSKQATGSSICPLSNVLRDWWRQVEVLVSVLLLVGPQQSSALRLRTVMIANFETLLVN